MNPFGNPQKLMKQLQQAQEKMQQRISELDYEVHEDEFTYWRRYDKQKKSKE